MAPQDPDVRRFHLSMSGPSEAVGGYGHVLARLLREGQETLRAQSRACGVRAASGSGSFLGRHCHRSRNKQPGEPRRGEGSGPVPHLSPHF